MAGRPSSYTEAMADRICEAIATSSKGLARMCATNDGWPAESTIHKWLTLHPYFAEQYARAREAQADYLADEIIEIADDGSNDTYLDSEGNESVNHDHIQRSRLRVDARKWKASKLAPKKYGDKIQQEVTGADGGAIKFAVIKRTIVQPEREKPQLSGGKSGVYTPDG